MRGSFAKMARQVAQRFIGRRSMPRSTLKTTPGDMMSFFLFCLLRRCTHFSCPMTRWRSPQVLTLRQACTLVVVAVVVVAAMADKKNCLEDHFLSCHMAKYHTHQLVWDQRYSTSVIYSFRSQPRRSLFSRNKIQSCASERGGSKLYTILNIKRRSNVMAWLTF